MLLCTFADLARLSKGEDGSEGCGQRGLGVAVRAQQLHEELDASLSVLVQAPLCGLGLLDDGGGVLPCLLLHLLVRARRL